MNVFVCFLTCWTHGAGLRPRLEAPSLPHGLKQLQKGKTHWYWNHLNFSKFKQSKTRVQISTCSACQGSKHSKVLTCRLWQLFALQQVQISIFFKMSIVNPLKIPKYECVLLLEYAKDQQVQIIMLFYTCVTFWTPGTGLGPRLETPSLPHRF